MLHHYFGEDPSLFMTFWNWSWKSSAASWPNYELQGGLYSTLDKIYIKKYGIVFSLQDVKILLRKKKKHITISQRWN